MTPGLKMVNCNKQEITDVTLGMSYTALVQRVTVTYTLRIYFERHRNFAVEERLKTYLNNYRFYFLGKFYKL